MVMISYEYYFDTAYWKMKFIINPNNNKINENNINSESNMYLINQ